MDATRANTASPELGAGAQNGTLSEDAVQPPHGACERRLTVSGARQRRTNRLIFSAYTSRLVGLQVWKDRRSQWRQPSGSNRPALQSRGRVQPVLECALPNCFLPELACFAATAPSKLRYAFVRLAA